MRPVRTFPRRSYDIEAYGDLTQADLAFFPESPQGYKYILILIDAFSRHLFAEPLKTKTSEELGKAFKKIFKEFGSPITKLETDEGTEFTGNRALFKEHRIYFHVKYQTHKASFAEAAISMLKRKLYMMLRSQLSNDWPAYLKQTVDSLNNRHVESLGGVRPADVNSVFDGAQILEAQEKKGIKRFREPFWKDQNIAQQKFDKDPTQKFKTGDYVYLDMKKTAFDKAYDIQISFCIKVTIFLCRLIKFNLVEENLVSKNLKR